MAHIFKTDLNGLTVFVHSHGETFFEPASLALIPVSLVDDATSGSGLTPDTQIPSTVGQFGQLLWLSW